MSSSQRLRVPSRPARHRNSFSAICILLVGALVAGLALACHHAFLDEGDPVVAAIAATPQGAVASFAERFVEAASFEDRFKPAVDTPLVAFVAPAVIGGQVAWLDPAYSFGPRPERFARSATPSPVQQVVVVKPQPQPKLQEVALLTPKAPLRELEPAAKPVDKSAEKSAETRAPKSRGPYSHDVLVRRAKAVLLAQAKAGKPSWFDKLFSKEPEAPVLAYASADGGDVTGSVGAAADDANPIDRFTAVYDIVGKIVYMPDGSKLEAHSGLGPKMDKPDYAHVKMHGVTPPHIYDITPREALFHGVAALRLTPLGGAGAIHNRTGLLAHNYLLGPNGDSNGCVSFKDYDRFLQAYRSGQVKRLVVIASMQ